jgi:folate-binding protein YgfZ
MLKLVGTTRPPTRLADMGLIRVQGADAVKFLQGQLSNDVARLATDRSVLAGLHNAQGRVIALLRMVLAGPQEILAILPRELAAPVTTRLSKFVLRAKVKISDASAEREIAGIAASDVAEGMAGASAGAARRDDEGRLWVCVGSSRWLVVNRSGQSWDSEAPPSLGAQEWHAFDIADGAPQVYAVTSEAFVAQMLNLDLVDGIAFDKGCYTGQEVIARAHYRGRVKRRMQRFRTSAPTKLGAGDAGTLSDGRSFKVVDAVELHDGRSEFLAVTTFDDAGAAAAGAGSSGDDLTDTPASANSPVNAEQLPLPYSLPT